MDDGNTAEKALHAALRAHKEFGPRGVFHKNAAVARNILHEDLGYYSEVPRDYGTDAALICRLAAHARQDAAHAVANTDTIMDELRRVKRRLWVVIALLVVVLLALAQHHG